MRSLTLIFLAVLAALSVSLGIFAILPRMIVSESQTITTQQRVLVSSESLSTAARIQILHGSEQLELDLEDGRWRLTPLQGYDADQDLVAEWLEAIAGVRLIAPRTGKSALMGRLGLDEAHLAFGQSERIRILPENNRPILDIVLGDPAPSYVAPGRNADYVRIWNDHMAWLATRMPRAELTPIYWAEKTIVDVPFDDLRSVTIAERGNEPIQIQLSDGANVRLNVGDQPLDLVDAGRVPVLDDMRKLVAIEIVPLSKILLGESERFIILRLKNRILVELNLHNQGQRVWLTTRAFLADRVGLDPYRAEWLDDRVEDINERRSHWAFLIANDVADRLRRETQELRELVDRDQ